MQACRHAGADLRSIRLPVHLSFTDMCFYAFNYVSHFIKAIYSLILGRRYSIQECSVASKFGSNGLKIKKISDS